MDRLRKITREILKNRILAAGVIILLILILTAILSQIIIPHDPMAMKFKPLAAVSSENFLGTNDSGQDIFSGLLVSIGNSISFGFIAAATALLLGVFAGCSSAFTGGIYDQIVMRTVDILLSIPVIMILILISATIQPGRITLPLILGALSWSPIARGIRAQCLTVREKLYIKSVRHLGGGFFYILKRHLIPEIFPLFIIGFSAKLRAAVIMEATLAFLGLTDPAEKSLGHMINYSIKYYYLDVWHNWIFPPIIVLSLIVLSVTFIAIGMETVFTPELKKIRESGEI